MADASIPATQTIAAVLADVDGTLVTKAKALTPRAIEAIERLHQRGVFFAITSGRPPRGMRMLVHPLEMRGPMAAFNGGIIVQPDMTIVDERAISADVTPAVIDTIGAHGLYAWLYRAAEWYVTDSHAPHAEREAATVQFQPTVVPSYDGLLDRVVKIVGVSDDHDRVARCEAAVQQQFGAHVSAARSQLYYLDVTHPMANKGVVIERLSHYYKIPLEQIATLGDQPNDVLMFQRSGLSIAMGNASEQVQREATCVTRAPAKSLPARSSGLHGACVCLRGAPPHPCSCPPRRRIAPTLPISDLWRTTLAGPCLRDGLQRGRGLRRGYRGVHPAAGGSRP